jgi:cell volume regulation protein A
MTTKQKTLISWVGLRGSVPIILATFPLTAGIPQADIYFNIVFFVVIASVFIQGTSIPFVSRKLKLDAPFKNRKPYPIEFHKMEGMDTDLTEIVVPHISETVGKKIGDLDIPEKCVIVLISRGERFISPISSTVLHGGDILLVLTDERSLSRCQDILSRAKESKPSQEV